MNSGKIPGAFTGTIIPDGKERWSSFGTGLVLECSAVALLILIPLVIPKRLQLAAHNYVTLLEMPTVHPWKPQPRPKPVIVKRSEVKDVQVLQPVAVATPKPKIYPLVLTTPVTRATMHRVHAAPTIAQVVPRPKLSTGSSAIPKLRVPVQTGGFGDPNGVPDNGNRHRNPNIALLGSFDMPVGPGAGNGSGGKNGARGTVTSAGFGNSVAVASGGNPHGTVEQGVFSTKRPAVAPRIRHRTIQPAYKPVVILSVPRPTYTAEGRAHKVQGVVLLQVLFTASGEVRVEGVIRGLGYGLDESAEDAARQIQFRPATRNGQPADSRAIARIVFALAS